MTMPHIESGPDRLSGDCPARSPRRVDGYLAGPTPVDARWTAAANDREADGGRDRAAGLFRRLTTAAVRAALAYVRRRRDARRTEWLIAQLPPHLLRDIGAGPWARDRADR